MFDVGIVPLIIEQHHHLEHKLVREPGSTLLSYELTFQYRNRPQASRTRTSVFFVARPGVFVEEHYAQPRSTAVVYGAVCVGALLLSDRILINACGFNGYWTN